MYLDITFSFVPYASYRRDAVSDVYIVLLILCLRNERTLKSNKLHVTTAPLSVEGTMLGI